MVAMDMTMEAVDKTMVAMDMALVAITITMDENYLIFKMLLLLSEFQQCLFENKFDT